MNELNEEIKLTLNLMQGDIDDDAHGELQLHLYSLLEMKRNEMQQRLVERSWLEPALGVDKARPLTVDELKAGGWWCADVSAECEMAFKLRGLDVVCAGWSGIGNRNGDCCILVYPKLVSRAWIKSQVSGEKQIHRIGNEFYWGDA